MTQIEVVHSTYGVVKAHVEKTDRETLMFFRPNLDPNHKYVLSDSFGELDQWSAGQFSHPNPDVDSFLSVAGLDLREVDERGYIELEDILFEAANKAFPGFFLEEAPSIQFA